MPTPTIWHIPYERNRFFTGREEVLAHLHSMLQADARVALSHPLGISGLGGIGKTQTALEYAYRYSAEYDTVLWVRADSLAVLTSSLVELARALKLPERHEKDQEIIVQAVLRWFRLHQGWLLIYDNIDDLSIAEPFLPKAGSGHLLFTTRSHALGGLAQRLDIQKMEPEIGALLLLRRARLLAIQAALDMANPDDQSIACTISQELDGLPLALDQAGAYVKEAPCSLPDYLARYQTRRGDILRERGSFDQDYPASVATTWSLSFEKVHQANPASVDLLNLCAFLAPDAIPETMITKGAQHLPSTLREVVARPLQFDQAIGASLAYSLLHRNTNETLDIHRLVQTVLRDDMSTEAQLQWKERVVLTVNAASPTVGDVKQWDVCEQWISHALACAKWIEQENIVKSEAAHLLNQAGYYLNERGRYHEVEPLFAQALFIQEHLVGSQHPGTALSLNNLAELYRILGKYEEAESLLKRALVIREQQLGAMHLGTATSLNSLALLYFNLGKYEEAEPLYQRALAIHEQQLGANHPDTAVSLNNLALLYENLGKYSEAEPLYQRALVIREQQLGAEHPDTAVSLNNLASMYYDQGKYATAEPLYRQVLTIREALLGVEHPDTVTSLHNLADSVSCQKKYSEAEPLYQQVLAIRLQKFGEMHPDTALTLINLAVLYHHQERYIEAEPLYQRALAIREQKLGAMHPATALSLNNLGRFYHDQERYIEAEPLLKRALFIYEQQLEREYPDIAYTLNNLALFYQAQDQYDQAEPLFQRALTIRTLHLGQTHPLTQKVRENYGILLQKIGREAQAMDLEEEV